MARDEALATYDRRRGDIARLIDVLQMELDAHRDKARADRHPWGFAGDLQKVREDLIELVGFMSQMERERVEDFLAEADAAPVPTPVPGGPPPTLHCPACGRRIDITKAP